MPGIFHRFYQLTHRSSVKKEPQDLELVSLINKLKKEVAQTAPIGTDMRDIFCYIDASEHQPDIEIPLVAYRLPTRIYHPQITFNYVADVLETIKNLREKALGDEAQHSFELN